MNCNQCGKELAEYYHCNTCKHNFCKDCIDLHDCKPQKPGKNNKIILFLIIGFLGIFLFSLKSDIDLLDSKIEDEVSSRDSMFSDIDNKFNTLNRALLDSTVETDSELNNLYSELDTVNTNLSSLGSSIYSTNAFLNEVDNKANILNQSLLAYNSEINSELLLSRNNISELTSRLEDINLEIPTSFTEYQTYVNSSLSLLEAGLINSTEYLQLIESSFTEYQNYVNSSLLLLDEELINNTEYLQLINESLDLRLNSLFLKQPQLITLPYVLRGVNDELTFVAYKGFRDYLSNIYPIDDQGGLYPRGFIEHEKQKEMLSPLVEQIKSLTSNKDDQARIAISLVQHILYDHDLLVMFELNELDAGICSYASNKFPYEVIYDNRAVCGGLSHLLTFLLKELGFGVVMFDSPSHRAVGIKCPMEYSYEETGYCFIETTNAVIITRFFNADMEISEEFEGLSFDSVAVEYNDNLRYLELELLENWNQSEYEEYINISDTYFNSYYFDYNHLDCPYGWAYCNDECYPTIWCPEGYKFICLPNLDPVCRNQEGEYI